jgi:hypothetical protein
MNTFSSLLNGYDSPEEQQSSSKRMLPVRLGQSKLHAWLPGMAIFDQGERVLIGVATWSIYDLQLLDDVQIAMTARHSLAWVDVFDVDECQSNEVFDRYVPGISSIFQTPVVGIWINGVMISSASGVAGRELLRRSGLIV